MKNKVIIDCFSSSVSHYVRGYAIVAVDVIRATTTIATAVSMGRRCFPVPSLESAQRMAKRFRNPLLAGEIGGVIPPGFEMNNSPASLASRSDLSRPLIILSSSGTKLIHRIRAARAAYIGCFRNFGFLSKLLAARHPRVAVIGAGNRGEFRQEDQMCCAWIAKGLMESGYSAVNATTESIVERWSDASPNAIMASASVSYLRRSGQLRDLDFILTHIGDLNWGFSLNGGEILGLPPGDEDSAPWERPASLVKVLPAFQS